MEEITMPKERSAFIAIVGRPNVGSPPCSTGSLAKK